jgi:hypothetical protein
MERADTGPSGPAYEYRPYGRSIPIIAMVILAALAALGLIFVWPG